MSILNTLAAFANKKQASIGAQGSSALNVLLDASVSETHTSSADITSHPVEEGSNISDHVRKQPDSIVITGIVSNTSTVFPQGIVGVALVRSVTNLVNNVSNDLAKTAYDQLRQMVEGKELIKVVTTLREYNDMLIENLVVTRDANNGDALNFTATAKQVRLIKTSSAEKASIPAPADVTKTAKKSLGGQSKQKIAPSQKPTLTTQKPSSILRDAANSNLVSTLKTGLTKFLGL